MAIQDIFNAVLAFDEAKVKTLTQTEIDAGADVNALLNEGLIAAMDDVGRKFSQGDLFVPEMLMAAHAMKAGLLIIKPLLTQSDANDKGTIVIGTVKGDLHDIGKNLVTMMLEGAGFNVIDIGVDMDADQFVTAARQHKAKIVALSALLTTTMPEMKKTVAAIREAGLSVKTMVGGAPVTANFADQIGADGYSDDAPGAVEMARRLLVG